MAALSGEKTLAELSAEFGVHPTMISDWKQELVKRAGELFGRGSKAPAAEDAQKVIDDLHRKIGQLQVECDFLAEQPAISRVGLTRFGGHLESLARGATDKGV
jgi:transposase